MSLVPNQADHGTPIMALNSESSPSALLSGDVSEND
jgi:hypothetical protein